VEEKKIHVKLEKHLWPDEIRAKRKKNWQRGFWIVSLVLVFTFGWVVGQSFGTTTSVAGTSTLNRLEAVYEIMKNDWYFGKDITDNAQKLIDNAIAGMISGGGDIHTSYMTKEELADFTGSIDMGFVGIGVQYYDSNGTYIIEKVFVDSPAAKAGVQPGDIIYKVDGTLMDGIGTDALATKVKGTAGTTVGIDFIRDGATVHLDIVRGAVQNSAYGYMLDTTTAYLEIYQFGSTTDQEVLKYLTAFKTAGATKIILDLRDNGGGYLSALESIGSMFVPEGQILIQQEKRDGTLEVSKSSGKIVVNFSKVVVLVNQNTASAAEVLTAALKEDIGAIVVGTTTYGKGTVQVSRVFSDGSALKYTIAQWLTPKGNLIDGIGIVPDNVIDVHEVLYTKFVKLDDGVTVKSDTVGEAVKDVQLALDFLGYKVDRMDGYFSAATLTALKAYQSEHGLSVTGEITNDLLSTLQSNVVKVWHQDNTAKDVQLKEAKVIVNG